MLIRMFTHPISVTFDINDEELDGLNEIQRDWYITDLVDEIMRDEDRLWGWEEAV